MNQTQLDELAAEIRAIQRTGVAAQFPYDLVEVSPTVLVRDGQLYVSAEDGPNFADYYGEYRGGYPWIAPELDAWAARKHGYWEWDNPGAIVFVPK